MAEKNETDNILDVSLLQQVQDTFSSMTNVASVMVDGRGEFVTVPSGAANLCVFMQQEDPRVQAFLRPHIQPQQTQQALTVTKCPQSGAVTASVSLTDPALVACWVVGPVRLEQAPVTEEFIELPQEACLTGDFEEIPFVSKKQWQAIMAFLQSLSQTMAELAGARQTLSASREALQKITAQYEHTAALFREFVDSAAVGMYVADYYTGEILMVNRLFIEPFGSEDVVLGKKCWELLGSEGTQDFCSYCRRKELLDENGQPAAAIQWELYREKEDMLLRVSSQAIHWVDGRLAHMLTYLDVTNELKMRQQLEKLAFFDNQFGLPNAIKLQQDMDGRTDFSACYFVCMDIVALRRVNEAYSRAAGDALLRAVTDWFKSQNFRCQAVYRVEGDQFCLFFSGVESSYTVEVANAIKARFNLEWGLHVNGQPIAVSVETVVAVVELEHTSPKDDDMLSFLEKVVDTARRTEDGMVVYTPEMDLRRQQQMHMELSLRNCVNHGMQGFDVHFQPIVDPTTGTWKALEALCRWTDPQTGKNVPPLYFIPEAEQLGLIRKVGIFALEKAISCCAKWGLSNLPGFFLSVNLSADQVLDKRFIERVTGLLKQYDFPGENLVLEVTENIRFTFDSHTTNVIEKLRFRGVRFSLDDFGTGYSSFNNLKNIPVSILKTEREFINGIEQDNYMQYFFYSMAELAHAADMRLVAEGVETQEQLDIILKNGADYVQGFLFSKPLPSHEVEANLQKFTSVDPSFYKLYSKRLTKEQIFSGRDEYSNSPGLYRLLNECMQIMMSQIDSKAAIDNVLAVVGQYFKVSRSFAFLKELDVFPQSQFEWCANGITPFSAYILATTPRYELEEWWQLLEQDGIIIAADRAILPVSIQDTLSRQKTSAIAVMPLFDEETMIGYAGFDCKGKREWLPEEILLLRNLCAIMSSAVKRSRLQQQLHLNDMLFADAMSTIQMPMMVTDLQTDEIIWINDSMKQLSERSVVPHSSKCYEVLHGLESRCEDCGKDQWHKTGGLACVMERYDPKHDRYLMEYNNQINWKGGKPVHLLYAVDITEIKRAQEKLAYFASTDALTGSKSRNSLMQELSLALERAHSQDTPVSIVFIDVDKLKFVNDTYGHSFGDQLLVGTVSAIRAILGDGGVVGRYGDDEFIAVLPGKTAQQATQLLESVRSSIVYDEVTHKTQLDFSFSYGVVDSSELPFTEGEKLVNAYINLADDRMRSSKKKEA